MLDRDKLHQLSEIGLPLEAMKLAGDVYEQQQQSIRESNKALAEFALRAWLAGEDLREIALGLKLEVDATTRESTRNFWGDRIEFEVPTGRMRTAQELSDKELRVFFRTYFKEAVDLLLGEGA